MKKTSKRIVGSPKPSRRPRAPRRALSPAPHVRALVAFADVARRAKLRWYVFGAQAVNLHGFPRATADLDLTIELGKLSIADLIARLTKAGFELRFADPAFVQASRVIPIVHQASGLPIDLVIGGPGLEQRFLDEVELHSIERRTIPVLSVENLIVTKLLAGRPKDLEDVRELLAVRGRELAIARIEELLSLLERALDQSDLRSQFWQLRDEATGKPAKAPPPRPRSPRRARSRRAG